MQNNKYSAAEVEAAAQSHWQAIDAYRVTESAAGKRGEPKPKFYACSMLPYPSGKLHMGHVRNYTINDMMARQLRMQGYNVLMPMGWDAFGLPAENAAMKNQVPPARWTYDNIAYMKKQMQAMGLAIDWTREIATCDPEYYRWNQWLFLKMLEHGIAYKKTQVVNWDPIDQTVLANEQVIDGKGWRSGAPVEKREIPGYYLNITRYAEELLDCVSQPEHPNFLSGWPERVRLMQENWIGKSGGVNFGFPYELEGEKKLLRVFTTRADTIMGVTFVAVAAEHALASYAAQRDVQVSAFVEDCKKGGTTEAEMATMEKKGVFTGLYVTHPLNQEKIPVWVGNYVLTGYGEGAVMGVPGHDERDFAFAKKYGLAIKQVINVAGKSFDADVLQDWYSDKEHGVCVNSDKYDGLKYTEAVAAIAADLQALGLGQAQTTYRLRDWGISRQRYWGTPIPIIHCDDCGDVPVPYADLPVVLPDDCVPDGSGNPLNKREDFLHVPCPKCGKPARRETDTMDTFVDSSWYYMRYCSPDNDEAMVDERNDYWMPMDQYIGGIEHAVLHLLYARFWTKVMRDLGLLSFNEPFKKLLTQGMVLNHIYSRKNEKGGIEYFWPHEVENVLDDKGAIVAARLKTDGSAIVYEGVGTMSKSKNNGVDPQELIDKYGADTARLFTMFAAPPEQTLEWNDAAVEGAHRFLKRLWTFCQSKRDWLMQHSFTFDPVLLPAAHKNLRRQIHLSLQQADADYQRMQYNTVVSASMKMLNALEEAKLDGPEQERFADSIETWRETISIMLRVLYPVVPHITHVLWQQLGYAAVLGDLLDADWPKVDAEALKQDEIELVVQVNGKLRGSILVPAKADKAAIEATALSSETVEKFISGQAVKKIIVVPGKLVNIVI
ncbi:MAG: leucine--tRNA ligase [Burkholderiales bacterium]